MSQLQESVERKLEINKCNNWIRGQQQSSIGWKVKTYSEDQRRKRKSYWSSWTEITPYGFPHPFTWVKELKGQQLGWFTELRHPGPIKLESAV